jgi:hypothetical protein
MQHDWKDTMTLVKSLVVGRSYRDDVYKDIVRIPEDQRREDHGFAIPEGTLCSIKTGQLRTYAFVRGLSESVEAVILIDDRTRNKLGVESGAKYDFEIEPTKTWGQIRWAWHAADPAYRIGSRLCLLSLLLGFVGLALGAVSLWVSLR